MSMKLGTLLVREGIINAHQLEEALRIQSIHGGRLGANLVELGYLDANVLGEWLGKKSGFPVATAEMFEEVDDEVLGLIPADFAERFECFPLKLEGRRLQVAMMTPEDLEAVDAVSFKTGLRVEPHVTPEVLLRYYLEERYGVQRDLRYIRLTPGEMGAVRVAAPTPAAIPPDAPPQAHHHADDSGASTNETDPTSLPQSPPVLVPTAVPTAPPAETPQEADWMVPPPAPPADSSWLGDGEEHSHDWTPPELPVGDAGSAGSGPVPPTLDFDAALNGLQNATNREELADCVLGFGAGVLDGIMLLTCRDDMALGWRGLFQGQDEPLVHSLMLPLNAPSIFQSVNGTAESFAGPLPTQPLLQQIHKALHRPEPRFIALVPVVVRGRVVNFIYGERHDVDVDDTIAQLEELAARVAEGYERIVLNAKLAAAR